MKVGENFAQPKSSFLIVEKDLERVFDKILTNPRLLKLLYYSESDCLSKPNLNAQQKLSLIHKQLKIVPKIDVGKECPIYIIVRLGNFVRNLKNPEFRNCDLVFQILCHPDHWSLGDFKLRPYTIAGEIDAMFNNSKMVGIGTLQFVDCSDLLMNEQLIGLSLTYRSVQSKEDVIPNE